MRSAEELGEMPVSCVGAGVVGAAVGVGVGTAVGVAVGLASCHQSAKTIR